MGWEDALKKMITTTAIVLFLTNEVAGELCKGYGHYCNAPLKCCASKCCYGQDYDTSVVSYYRWNLWNMWYFWFIIVFILMSCFGGCGYYKRRQMLFSRQRMGSSLGASGPPPRAARALRRGTHVPVTVAVPIFPSAYAYSGPGSDQPTYPYGVSAGDSRQPGSFVVAPPPYSEVVSHPSLYPVNKTELPPYPGQGALPVTTITNTGGVTDPVGSQSAAIGHQGGDVSQGQPPLPPYSAVVSQTAGHGSPPITAETPPTSTEAPPTAPAITVNTQRTESS